jgi:hypothetical protein
VLLKFEPDVTDVGGLFDGVGQMIDDFGLRDDFYKTSIIKCSEEHDDGNAHLCRYFGMEWNAIKRCPPKLIICTDGASIEWIGGNATPGKIQNIGQSKAYFASSKNSLELIFKILANQQARNRLFCQSF